MIVEEIVTEGRTVVKSVFRAAFSAQITAQLRNIHRVIERCRPVCEHPRSSLITLCMPAPHTHAQQLHLRERLAQAGDGPPC